MSENSDTTVWYISNPPAWPKPPHWMSFSTLSELEACSRRWALSVADYPHVWKKRGYPRIPQISALEGTVVHLALEKISHALVKRGCHSLIEERAFTTLKDLGGYTVIITDCIESALRQYEGNPRATPVLGYVRQRLVPRVPKIRTHVQRLLSRIHLATGDGIPLDAAGDSMGASSHQLPYGSHAEIELKVPELGWHGIADFLTHTSHFCEIRDFKTGTYKPQQKFQLLTYALLWARDRNLNPLGRLANKLVLSYDENDVEVPAPNEDDLSSLEIEIRKRTEAVLLDLRLAPPEARPSQENCAYCSVRQLCEEYWQWQWHGQQKECYSEFPAGFFTDLQIQLTTRHGPTSWNGIAESSPSINVGQSILLRTSNVPFSLRSGQRIRLLNVHINKSLGEDFESENPTTIATMGTNTEVFLFQK